MARTGYQYGTSPRKLEPDYTRKPKQKRKQLKVVEDIPRQQIKVSKEQRKRQMKTTVTVVGLFLLLLTISCRNSQIDKQFNQIQNQKKQLAALQKDNEQLKVSIENSINISNIEKVAKEELGMQKLTSILFTGAGEYQWNWILRMLDQEKKNIRVNKKIP